MMCFLGMAVFDVGSWTFMFISDTFCWTFYKWFLCPNLDRLHRVDAEIIDLGCSFSAQFQSRLASIL